MRMTIGLVLASLTLPASAAVTVIGSSSARLCYEAARSSRASSGASADCDAALTDEALTIGDEVATYVNRGIIRAVRGDDVGALKDYDAALSIDPQEAEAWLNKGFLLLRGGQNSAAVSMFDAAVAKRTSEPGMAHYGRAVAYEQLGNLRAAFADYRRATQLAPKWDAPRVELARFQVRAAGTNPR